MTFQFLILEAFNLPPNEQYKDWFDKAMPWSISPIPPKEWITELKRVIYEADTKVADEDGNVMEEVYATADELSMFNEYEHEREGYLDAYLRGLSPEEAYREKLEMDN